ncbi:hypothetical protein [Vagococcus lutrae]|uniref:hypothetical protein n=1 Tax=Vagococcus lutrae TaxID=81947 RepID=UPI00200E40B2|nr:hypothetical protein [Vagococcus lutrae]MDT2843023.1 hypothetical protein [Vagococcus lutrae]UQF72098.1 hypothetical protein M2901_10085 [Vagococcus lutrae]
MTDKQEKSVLDNVEFSMDWVKKADAEIKRKKREKREEVQKFRQGATEKKQDDNLSDDEFDF